VVAAIEQGLSTTRRRFGATARTNIDRARAQHGFRIWPRPTASPAARSSL